MNTIRHFTDLDAWKVNHKLILESYRVIKLFPQEERFGITDQLRRALISITSNIAEGWGMFHFANKIRHYFIARGSSCEVQNLLIVTRDLNYLNEEDYNKLRIIVFKGYQLINGLIRSTEKTKNKNKENTVYD